MIRFWFFVFHILFREYGKNRQNCEGRFWYHLLPVAEADLLVAMPVLAHHSKTTVSTASH